LGTREFDGVAVNLYPFKNNYRIKLVGWADDTEIEFFLDGHEVPLLQEIADKINEAAPVWGRQPRMFVTEIK
jgi:hypothetical protein